MTALDPADLFRKEARDHLLRGEDGLRRLEVSPPWTWALLWLLLAALGTALVLAVVGSVEVNSRAIGILRPAAGVRVLVSQVPGTVASVSLDSGDRVSQGDTVLQIDAPELQGQLLEAQRELGLLESDFNLVSQQQDHLHQQQVAQTRTRLAKLGEQIESERASLVMHRHKFDAMRSLESSAVVSGFAVLDAQEALAQAQRRLAGAEQSLALGRQELAALDSQRQAELWVRRQSLESARSHKDAVLLANRQTRIVAPQDGLVEALLVKPGDDVQAGQAVGKLIPSGTPLVVVSFLPEKDRAFVRVGNAVRLELDQLPYGEYGTLGARVVRIGEDLASPHEVTEALGDGRTLDGPAFRVVLAITGRTTSGDADITLRSGMLTKVRYTLRRQRPITMVLEPLRKWLH